MRLAEEARPLLLGQETGHLGEHTFVRDTGVFVGVMYGSYGRMAAASDWVPRRRIVTRTKYTVQLDGLRVAIDLHSPPGGKPVFAGGYAAGYYSYKWAEVLSADAYAAFEETAGEDGLPSVQTGRKYRQAILESGGSRPAMESFKAFRGREPTLDALLRHQGMA